MKSKTIVLGVTSGIAAYKTVELVQLLKKDKFEVFVIMTQNAAKMVQPRELEHVSGNKVYTELFEQGFDYKNILKIKKVDHIDLADKAHIFVVAPATANTIAKLACGIADDFLTTSILATQAPILICPSMNVHMYENPVVQQNLAKLRSRGFFILDPDEGNLACGYRGKGRLAHIHHIRDEIHSVLNKRKQLKGKKVIVTAGPTLEKIDDIRFITNKSSGKMGVAIAEECWKRGAEVLLLRASTAVKPSVTTLDEEVFEGIDELESLVNKYVSSYDVIFHTAAVSDFRIKNVQKGKISSKQGRILTLHPAKKIINDIKKLNPKIKLIGFKAVWGLQSNKISSIAQEKIKESKADAIVINDVSRKDTGFGVDTNEVYIVTKNGKKKRLPIASKQEIAKGIIDFFF